MTLVIHELRRNIDSYSTSCQYQAKCYQSAKIKNDLKLIPYMTTGAAEELHAKNIGDIETPNSCPLDYSKWKIQ